MITEEIMGSTVDKAKASFCKSPCRLVGDKRRDVWFSCTLPVFRIASF